MSIAIGSNGTIVAHAISFVSNTNWLRLTQMVEYRLGGEGGPRDVEARIVALCGG